MKKSITIQEQLNEYVEDLEQEISNWNNIFSNGCIDPFYPDGGNLNLVRNHIISSKRSIKELCNKNRLPVPSQYLLPTPAEVDDSYMAHADEIRSKAKEILESYFNNTNYKKLLAIVYTLTEKQKDKTAISNVINYALGLQRAIESDDLVTMRCHVLGDYTKSFEECLHKAQSIKLESHVEGSQVTLFDCIYDNEDENEDFAQDMTIE